MNKPLRRVAIFCGLLVLALLLRVNYVQFVQADELNSDSNNRRVKINEFAQPRGDIIVGDKAVTGHAESDAGDFKYERTYTDGAMWAPVTGHASQLYGNTMLEGVENDFLTGQDDRLFFNRTIDLITGKERKGGNVVTTLNAKAQKAAYQGLGDKKGAVVAMDPRTGAILAMASTPSYDPAKMAGTSKSDTDYADSVDDKNNPDQPELNRALRASYPPGSTFKLVTAAAALENGKAGDIDAKTHSPVPYVPPGTTLPLKNEGNIKCKDVSLREALRVSCNSVFGKLGVDVGLKDMVDEAEKFGFNKEQFVPVRASRSNFDTEMSTDHVAQSAIGQFDTSATPLQMCMVASAIANNGVLMQPYEVDKLVAPNLSTISQTSPHQLSQPLSAENAQKLQSMMETVVTSGTGTNAKIPGVKVGGKTGTAQHGVNNDKAPYAWFVSYAMTDQGSPVAVAVVIEDSNAQRNEISGGGLAAPIAKSVMEAVLGK